MSVSIFAGPESVEVTSPWWRVIGSSRRQAVVSAAGASFNWTGWRTSFFGDFVRRTNDGGGLQGPTQVDFGERRSASADGPFLDTLATGSYGNNDSLTDGPNDSGVGSVYVAGRAASSGRFARASTLLAGYSHEIQKGQDLLLPDENAHRNSVWFSISYSFARPLGR